MCELIGLHSRSPSLAFSRRPIHAILPAAGHSLNHDGPLSAKPRSQMATLSLPANRRARLLPFSLLPFTAGGGGVKPAAANAQMHSLSLHSPCSWLHRHDGPIGDGWIVVLRSPPWICPDWSVQDFSFNSPFPSFSLFAFSLLQHHHRHPPPTTQSALPFFLISLSIRLSSYSLPRFQRFVSGTCQSIN